MQLKLLNFHKILSQFASNIVGAFIALIIYQSTDSFSYAFLFMFIAMALRIFITKIFYKQMAKRPQLFLLIRLIPFLLYSVCVLLFDTPYRVLGIVLASIFYGFTVAFKDIPLEFVFSYSSLNKGTSSLGLSRFISYCGVILAIILGGLFLDNLPKWIAIFVACVTYLISVIPLFIYYLKNRKTKGFNKEAISNAVESFKQIKIKKHQQTVISKKLLTKYFIIYLLFCVYDALISLFNLYLFKVSAESYGLTSYIQASFYGMFALGCFVSGKLDEKLDLTKIVCFCCVFSGILVCLVPLVTHLFWLEIILFALIGFCYSFVSIFCYSRMMTRCKIMGVSNRALLNRAQASRWAQMIIYGVAMLSPVMFIPAFILTGLMFASCSIAIPINEEKTREILVDYLENNKLY
ncbi:MAG: MFS transporter [Clostridia bacterium]|nr:MFS transporter [Clostridia bacterium]